MAAQQLQYVTSNLELPQASSFAAGVDNLYDFMWWASQISFWLTMGAVVYFMIKYRRTKQGHTTAYIPENHALEAVWTIIPIIFLAIIFVWGWIDYEKMRTPANDAYEINIMGRQWMWEASYATGKAEIGALHVPKGRPVKLIMTSSDVLHSFYIPAFRVKQDVVPGQFTILNFTAIQTGQLQVICAEYCGTSHSGMLAVVTVMEPEDFDRWVEGMPVQTGKADGQKGQPEKLMPIAQKGEHLFKQKNCVTCHSTEGGAMAKVGPSLKGQFGHLVDLENGNKQMFDENYIRESITDPQAKKVAGFAAVMPTFKGLLRDEELTALVAYIKSLK